MPRQAYDWAKYDAHKKEEGPSGPKKKKTGLALLQERDGVRPVQPTPEGDPATWRLVARKLRNISAGVAAVTGYVLAVSSGTDYYVKEQDRQAQVAKELDAQAEALIRLADAFPQHEYLHPADPNSFVETSLPSGLRPTRTVIHLKDPTYETLWFVRQHLESLGIEWESAIDGDSKAALEVTVAGVPLHSPDFLTDHMGKIPVSSPTGTKRQLPDMIANHDAVSSKDPHIDKRVSILISRSEGTGKTKGLINEISRLDKNNDRYAFISIGPDTSRKGSPYVGAETLAANVVVEPTQKALSPVQQAMFDAVDREVDDFLQGTPARFPIASDMSAALHAERKYPPTQEDINAFLRDTTTAIAADMPNIMDDEEEMQPME